MTENQFERARNRNRLTKQQWKRKLKIPFTIIMLINAGLLSGIVAVMLMVDEAAQRIFQFFGLG